AVDRSVITQSFRKEVSAEDAATTGPLRGEGLPFEFQLNRRAVLGEFEALTLLLGERELTGFQELFCKSLFNHCGSGMPRVCSPSGVRARDWYGIWVLSRTTVRRSTSPCPISLSTA